MHDGYIYLPNLTSLHIKDYFWDDNAEDLLEQLPIFFPKLSDLHLGVKTIDDDEQVGGATSDELDEASERDEAARTFFAACKFLERLCFNGKYNLTRERISPRATING
ncbi:uncharacterized protein MYCFIDRAFT_201882 [Pseudocercospora fijiensis CIRAD86]|uniref:Uncharacterized protein n=1 Tax=Pseudocercospora fijiensis (strain CIRAD86) TaxID=383855 RepID=N1Q8V3_PSEFD|nr:uncharacterized protein MYCFIDRAFT_201882 [Pseudocercospora fijiensis CIRAD86]EME89320.1 hypothetical protein MYCFIDRAFT_201882 [Pseudocercospora fijiensis CIRAD86]